MMYEIKLGRSYKTNPARETHVKAEDVKAGERRIHTMTAWVGKQKIFSNIRPIKNRQQTLLMY